MKYTFIIDFQGDEKRDAHVEAKMDGEGSDNGVLMELCVMPYFLGNVFGGVSRKIIESIYWKDFNREAIGKTIMNQSVLDSIQAGFDVSFLGKEGEK